MTCDRRPSRRLPRPLDGAALDALALHYVGRFATTRAKLADFLRRKVRERGWDGPAVDPALVAERMARLGYVDDRAFAEMRAAALARRGYGGRRVAQALQAAGVSKADADAALEAMSGQGAGQAVASALAFARRRRLGPWAAAAPDDRTRERQIAAMIRAGHAHGLSRRIVATPPGVSFDDG